MIHHYLTEEEIKNLNNLHKICLCYQCESTMQRSAYGDNMKIKQISVCKFRKISINLNNICCDKFLSPKRKEGFYVQMFNMQKRNKNTKTVF